MKPKDREDPSIVYVREVKISYGPRKKSTRITSSQSAFELAKKIIDTNADREHFAAIYLDAKNNPIAWRVIGIGTLTGCLVHPREVFRPALVVGAAAVVCIHNHPSGELTPSVEDIKVTNRLRQAGDLVGLKLLDHLIIGDGDYRSMADRGHFFPGNDSADLISSRS